MSINSENSLLSNKIVYDITKFTHLDYPDKLACIVWFYGCNMRCAYCYNDDIVYANKGNFSLDDVLEFLKSRQGLLDGVVLSGGEATNYNLTSFVKKVKELGFAIKLDTNGTNFNNLLKLCSSGFIDYVALDYKAPEYKFKALTLSNRFGEFSKSLNYLLESSIAFEVRTTVHADLLDEQDINEIIVDLAKRGYKRDYFIQEFLTTKSNIGNIKAPEKSISKVHLLNDRLNIVFR